MPNIFVGNVHPTKGAAAEDLFTVAALVPGEEAAGAVAETGCKMVQPT
jgi:branched-chain amino acid transport system substrate-binding protein